MVGALLLRGMLAGVLAGLLCFGFLKVFGEPSVDRAIAFETQLDETKANMPAMPGMTAPKDQPGPELVSRAVQAGIGLFTGVVIYSAAFGGLFALAFALAYGRIADLDARGTAALLAALGIIAVYIVPALKYPPNPPSVGDAETIGMRTALYFSMIAISLAAMIVTGMLRARLQPRQGQWNALLISSAVYLILVGAAGAALPSVNEVPDQFPAVVLWQFRIAALGAQLILWATLGLVFGVLTERAATSHGRLAMRTTAL
jgi:predicted cobalt transporter CbtA